MLVNEVETKKYNMVDKKMELFLNKELWSTAIQHLIDKGVRPAELSAYTTPEFRAMLVGVIENGNYYVAPPHVSLIPKDNGEFRKVYVNTVLDRLVLSIINSVCCDVYKDKIHPKCVSYQKGIGVRKIMQRITEELSQKHSRGYKIDISKYFDSVDRKTLDELLKQISSGSSLDKVIWDYYHDDLIMNENGEMETHYKSLAQGCAVAAFLANMALRDVDEEMDKMCDIYYRYSDDILILGDHADEALEKLKKMLECKGLHINPKKISPVTENEWFTFLGMKIKGRQIGFSQKSLKNIQDNMLSRIYCSKGCKKELKKSIKKVNSYLYSSYLKDSTSFGWGEYFFGTVNCEKDIILIDEWIKDVLRSEFTGKKKIGGLGCINGKENTLQRGRGRNVKENLNKTKGLLEQCGYVSMHHLYKVYNIDRDVYRAEIARYMM